MNKVTPDIRALSPAPPLLILACLLIWGWRTDFLLFGLVMGISLELPAFIRWRIDFSDKDVNQIVDLSGLLFFIVTIYLFVSYGAQGIYKVLEITPFILFLVLLTQRYSTRNKIKTSALFVSIRRLGQYAGDDLLYEVDISLPYLFMCLISASAIHEMSQLFFVSIVILLFWLMWTIRPGHYPVYRWLLPMLTMVIIGYGIQAGMKHLHRSTESLLITLFDQYGWHSRSSEKFITAIGSVGRLKLSDRVILRIESDTPYAAPLYLQETSYSHYDYGIWRNDRIEYDVISKEPNQNLWRLHPEEIDLGSLNFAMFLDEQSAILPTLNNINSLSGKDLVQVETNPYGTTRVDTRAGWIKYRMGYGNTKALDVLPDKADLTIPQTLQADFKRIAQELNLYDLPPEQQLQTIKRYFADNFYYSVSQNQRYVKGGYLPRFLFEHKKGHCEYFATATALLLRELGIPSRYTVGFAADEYSAWQNAVIVRARHAHSWVQYYLNGEWHLLDTTPANWAPLEAADRTALEPLMDLLSWLRYVITSEEIEGSTKSNTPLGWLLIPLILYLAWRFYKKPRVKQTSTRAIQQTDLKRTGTDSPAYALINKLEQRIAERKPGETLTHWLRRIFPNEPNQNYMDIIKLHYRYRFKPNGNKAADKQSISNCIERLPH